MSENGRESRKKTMEKLDWPNWGQMQVLATEYHGQEWKFLCEHWGQQAQLGELGWSHPGVLEVMKEVIKEDRVSETSHYKKEGPYKGDIASKTRVALAWVMVEAKDGREVSAVGDARPIIHNHPLPIYKMIKRGFDWSQGEWELIHKWADHTGSHKNWIDEVPSEGKDREDYLKLMSTLLKKTSGDIPFYMWPDIFLSGSKETQELARQVLSPERLVETVKLVCMRDRNLKEKEVIQTILTQEWWAALGKENQTKLLTNPRKDLREIVIKAIGNYEIKPEERLENQSDAKPKKSGPKAQI